MRANESFETPDKANAMLIGGLAIPLSDRSPDYAATIVAERIFGGGLESRLFAVVRQQLGLSYGVGTFMEPGQFDANSTLGMYAIFAPENLAKVRDALAAQTKLALDKGFTAEEVANAKSALIEERKATRSQDGALAGGLVAQAWLGRTWAQSAELDRAIEAVTVESANAAFRKYVKPDDLATFVAGDFAKKKSRRRAGQGGVPPGSRALRPGARRLAQRLRTITAPGSKSTPTASSRRRSGPPSLSKTSRSPQGVSTTYSLRLPR